MKTFFLRAGVCPLLLVLFVSSVSSAQDWKKIPIPKLPAFSPQEPKRIELPNGMSFMIVPNAMEHAPSAVSHRPSGLDRCKHHSVRNRFLD